jgi:hypothetical protein
MTDQLREAFRDLAADAPDIDATAASSSQTWRRARSARRRGIVAVSFLVVAMLIGGVFVAVGLSGITKPAPAKPVPYDESKLAIPNRVWLPSEWTPSTDDAGPLGPLALASFAPRRTSWFDTDPSALYGVSAATGEYRFIDLPDADFREGTSAELALSPDGTEIGYWLLGEVAKPQPHLDDVGFAEYNTVSGRVTRHVVPTRYGLAPSWMTWSASGGQLAVAYSQWQSDHKDFGGTSGDGSASLWTPASNHVVPMFKGSSFDLTDLGIGKDRRGLNIFEGTRRSLLTVNPRTGSTSSITLSLQGSVQAMRSPDGSLIAFGGASSEGSVQGDIFSDSFGGAGTSDVFLARRPASAGSRWPARDLHLPSPATELVGWIDSGHLMVEVFSTSRFHLLQHPRFVSVDVSTGTMRTVLQLEFPNPLSVASIGFATELIGKPFVPGQAPHNYRDPRVLPGVAVGVLAAVLLVGVFWWLQSWGRRRRVLVGSGARL